jgi:two-component system chemotaxis sensor kinase CheA
MDGLDLYELFLALAEGRLAEARAALEARDEARLAFALLPMSVDAALLGAEGLAALAKAIARAGPVAEAEARRRALDLLGDAIAALGRHDASGARADEAELVAVARALDGGRPQSAAGAPVDVAPAPKTEDPAVWIPTLPEDLASAFLDECHERIEALSQRLLELEAEGAQGAQGETVRAVFRDLHTLKGSSGFAGLGLLNALAHAAEDLVGKIRDGQELADRAVIDVLLATLDRFRAIVDRASARAPIDVPIDDLLSRIRAPRARVVAPSGRPAEPPAKADRAAGTLRVEFERVDQLQNFVNELVLARARLTRATEGPSALGRELARLRRRLAELRLGDPALPAISEELGRAERVLDESGAEAEAALATLGGALGQLRERVMRLRMVPIARLFTKHQRTVRELAQTLGKAARLELRGQETELDKVLVEQLEDPLIHLVRNALDHGLETPELRRASGKPEVGTLSLRARQQGGSILVEIEDDGAGIDPARVRTKAIERGIVTAAEAAALDERATLDLIFRAGFSTAAAVTDVSGRGVGMDVVREAVERLKGTIELRSTLGAGTTFELRLPLTLAVAQILLVRAGGQEVALPLDAITRSLARTVGDDVAPNEIEDVGGRPCLVEETDAGIRRIPIVDLATTLGVERRQGSARAVGGGGRDGHLVLVHAPLPGIDAVALDCDGVLGRHDVVVKPLGPLLVHAPLVAGAGLVGDRVVLLLDVAAVVRRGLEVKPTPLGIEPRREAPGRVRGRILVAEDTDVVREAMRRALEAEGYEVVAARDGEEALERARAEDFDAVSTDVVMPRLDGYGLTRALRAMPRHAKVPIVMVTSKDQRVDVLRGYDAGVDAYVTKPADVRALLRTLAELLRQRA